jgi:branched-chain amino acid transport system substrate-binding protein
LLAAKRLIEQEKVNVIIGPVRTDEGMAIKPYIDSAKVPTVMHCASDIIVDASPAHWVFRRLLDQPCCSTPFCLFEGARFEELRFFYAQIGFGKDALQLVQKFAPEYGINIVGIESFGDRDVDMKPQLLNLTKQKSPSDTDLDCGAFGFYCCKKHAGIRLQSTSIPKPWERNT